MVTPAMLALVGNVKTMAFALAGWVTPKAKITIYVAAVLMVGGVTAKDTFEIGTVTGGLDVVGAITAILTT